MVASTRSQTAKTTGFLPSINRNDHSISDRSGKSSSDIPAEKTRKLTSQAAEAAHHIPTYQIDLSSPPIERYAHVAADFKEETKDLPALFDNLLHDINQEPERVHRWARRLLHRIHDKEQTEELRGISKVLDTPMYLLICFNTLLDLLMGCSSGGIRAKCSDGGIRMLHYRTLDWSMDPLRKIVVQLNFVERPGGPVIARSITYVGFVGVLTGVRENLSLSLNFRPYHNNNSSLISNVRFYGHLALVLFGWRPSISSKLRALLLRSRRHGKVLPDLASITNSFPAQQTTAAYLIFSDGQTTTVLEKDRATAKIMQSNTYIACTNNDVYDDSDDGDRALARADGQRARLADEGFLLESVDRKRCMNEIWQRHVAKVQRKHRDVVAQDVHATQSDVVRWVQKFPITNECTHYACIMDPIKGDIIWMKKWLEPLPG